MVSEPLDKELTDLLGSDAATALTRWARLMGLRFGYDRLLVNGRSAATVASVYEWPREPTTRKLVLKHDFVDESKLGSAEYSRQLAALREAPPGFAEQHMTAWAHEPVSVPDGSWITFQDIVGGGPVVHHAMTSLLAGDPAAAVSDLRVEPVRCDRSSFVEVTLMVVRSILSGWAQSAVLHHMPASKFVGLHIEDRADPGRPLADLARAFSGSRIVLPHEPAELINPFRFLTDTPAAFDLPVPALLGRAHGDLHTENVMVSSDLKTFKLIDFPRYRDDAPLTRDPVYLLLSIINRTMGELADIHREILLDRLTGSPTPERWAILPAWLRSLIDGVETAGLEWIAASNLGREWQQATRLSMAASAMIFLARPTTSATGKEWFLRLAARSAQTYVGAVDSVSGQTRALAVGAAAEDAQREGTDDDNGLAELCHNLGVKRYKAKEHKRSRDLEQLVTMARLGHDIRQAYRELMTAIGYHGQRYLPGAHRGHPVVGEIFHCPLAIGCSRVEQRGPRGETPICFVQYGNMEASYR